MRLVNKSIGVFVMPRPEDFPAPPQEHQWEEYIRVKEDPLTFEQQIKIISFAYKFRYALLKDRTNQPPTFPATNHLEYAYLFGRKGPYRTLTQDQLDDYIIKADNLLYAPLQFEEESFQELAKALNNPATKSVEFGIDPSVPQQLYACSILLESVFKSTLYIKAEDREENDYNRTWPPYYQSMAYYRDSLCGSIEHRVEGRTTLSSKQKLLMRMDPIQKTSASSSTSLDFLLEHTHFATGIWSWQSQINPDGSEQRTEHTQDRETYRRLIRQELNRLYDSPSTGLVMKALGELMQEHELFLLISMSFIAVSFYDHLPTSSANPMYRSGFYDGTNAICSAGILNPADNNKVVPQSLGTIAHESLHLLFDKLLHQSSSPVRPGEEATLDEAIAKDRHYRQEKFSTPKAREHFTPDEYSVWKTVVEDLEQERSYFNGDGVSPHTMRVELIVRPMEQLASGVSSAAVENIMPHVWRYYQEHCEPLLTDYVTQRIRQRGVATSSPREMHTKDKVKIKEDPLLTSLLAALKESKNKIPPEHQAPVDDLIDKISAYQTDTNRNPSLLKTQCTASTHALKEMGGAEERSIYNALIGVVRTFFRLFDYLYAFASSKELLAKTRPCLFQYASSQYSQLSEQCKQALDTLLDSPEPSLVNCDSRLTD